MKTVLALKSKYLMMRVSHTTRRLEMKVAQSLPILVSPILILLIAIGHFQMMIVIRKRVTGHDKQTSVLVAIVIRAEGMGLTKNK